MNERLTAIVVLNWNGWRDTLECLESLYKMNYRNFHVIVVDNGSIDDSVIRIKEFSRGRANFTLLELDENQGFAKGNNIGIKHAILNSKPDYIMTLNNDTVVDSNFLKPMIETLEKDPVAGLAGPKIIDYYSKIHWQGVARDRISLLTTLLFFTPMKWFFIRTPLINRYLLKDNKPQSVYGINGCCMLFKRQVLEEIGLFDETTFLGWEEYIIAEKLLKKGCKTYAVPQSIIYHKVARDTVKHNPIDKILIFMKSEGYFQKTYLKMPEYQRWAIKIIRLKLYFIAAIFNKTYRSGFVRLAKAIIEA